VPMISLVSYQSFRQYNSVILSILAPIGELRLE
jgi:hypothetical protein